MWGFIATELLTSIEREPEESVVPEMMESFAKVEFTLNYYFTLMLLHNVCLQVINYLGRCQRY